MRHLVFLIFISLTQATLAQNVGVQAIGLERFSGVDTDILAGQLATVRRPIELAVLPFEFRGSKFAGTTPIGLDDPVFTNTRRIATYVLENNPSTFTLTLHLYFAHAGDGRTLFRYSAFKRNANNSFANNSASDIQFRNEIRDRSLRTAAFFNGLWSWANARGIVNRLRLVTIPELEDSATAEQWLDCQRFIRETYATVGAITLYRRSVHGGDRSRAGGLPYEKHGSTSAVSSISSGDAYSNDGADIAYANLRTTTSTTISLSSFQTATSSALRGGKSVLYWRNTFNGPRDIQPPYSRPVLTPFSNSTYGPNEQTALWIFLNTY